MLDFSIVVPSYGRPEKLRELLGALAMLDYPASRFEVIVVDDGSPTPLYSLVPRPGPLSNLTLLTQKNLGPSSARNRGAGAAQGRYLAFTDDDCRPQPAWLGAMSAALGESESTVCGGRTVNGLPGNLYSEASQLLLDYLSAYYRKTEAPEVFFPSNNLALSRAGFLKVGGFDATLRFGEDRDFCSRCASSGFAFAYAPDAVVHHSHDQTLRSFIQLHASYGAGTYAFRRGCVEKGLPRVRIGSPIWYLNLILSGIRKAGFPRGAKLSLLLFGSQAASLAGMIRACLRHAHQVPGGQSGRPGAGSAARLAAPDSIADVVIPPVPGLQGSGEPLQSRQGPVDEASIQEGDED